VAVRAAAPAGEVVEAGIHHFPVR